VRTNQGAVSTVNGRPGPVQRTPPAQASVMAQMAVVMNSYSGTGSPAARRRGAGWQRPARHPAALRADPRGARPGDRPAAPGRGDGRRAPPARRHRPALVARPDGQHDRARHRLRATKLRLGGSPGNPGRTRREDPPPLLADLDCAVRGSGPLLRVCLGSSVTLSPPGHPGSGQGPRTLPRRTFVRAAGSATELPRRSARLAGWLQPGTAKASSAARAPAARRPHRAVRPVSRHKRPGRFLLICG